MTPIEPRELRAHLLEVEPPNVERLQVLQREIRNVFTQELTRRTRASRIVALAAALASAGFAWYVASHLNASSGEGSPGVLRLIWTIFMFVCLASALRSAVILWRGHDDLREARARVRVHFGLNIVIAILLIVQAVAHPTIPMLCWALFGLLWVIVGAARTVVAHVKASELTTREALLRLELRLAESSSSSSTR